MIPSRHLSQRPARAGPSKSGLVEVGRDLADFAGARTARYAHVDLEATRSGEPRHAHSLESLVHRRRSSVTASVLRVHHAHRGLPGRRAQRTPGVADRQGDHRRSAARSRGRTIVESIAGVHSVWVYGIPGRSSEPGRGGVGGYFVEQHVELQSGTCALPSSCSPVGVGLRHSRRSFSRSTACGTSRATPRPRTTPPRTRPPANPGAPRRLGHRRRPRAATTPRPSLASPARRPHRLRRRPRPRRHEAARRRTRALSLFDVNRGAMRLGKGSRARRCGSSYSASEIRQYGLAQQTEVRMPLVKIAF